MKKEGKFYFRNFLLIFFLVVFTTAFSNATDLTDCGTLSSADTVYNLLNDVNSTGTCFTITASNVTLDLNGYSIIYGNQSSATSYYGVYSNQYYTIVKNGSINRGSSAAVTNTRYGIYFLNNRYNLVDNITMLDNYHGIYSSNSNYTNITNVYVNNSGFSEYGYGIFFSSGAYNQVNNATSNYNYRGIYFYKTILSNVSNVVSNYNSDNGVEFNQASYCRVVNASLDYNTAEGLWDGGAAGRNVFINISAKYNFDGISMGVYSTLENSTAFYNDNYGISVASYEYNFTAKNNNASGNGYYDYEIPVVFFTTSPSNSTFTPSNIMNFSKKVYYNVSASNYEFNSVNSPDAGVVYCFLCNNVTYKDLSLSGEDGLALISSNNSQVQNVTVSNSIWGIVAGTGKNNTFNLINSYLNDYGIRLHYDPNDTITNSTFYSNRNYSVYLSGAGNFTLANSSISSTLGYGIYNLNSANAWLYNNFLNNTINYEHFSLIAITLNTTLTSRTNIMGRLYTGGNFWGYPNGTGFSDTCTDADKNGICDSAYNSSGYYDYLPLYIADTSGPVMAIPFYTNGTLKNISETLDLNVSVEDILSNVSSCFININGTNLSTTYSNGWCNLSSISLTGASGGNTTIKVYANDSLNNWGLNDSYIVTIDSGGPTISANSPTNTTYSTSSITFNISSIDDSGIVSSCNYSFDNELNLSLTYSGGYWIETVSSLSEQQHNVTFYCWDSFGKIGSSTEYFTISIPVEDDDGGGSGGGSSTTTVSETSTFIEKSTTVILSGISANLPSTSTINLAGIELTGFILNTNKDFSSASIKVTTVNPTSDLVKGLSKENIYQALKINSSIRNENINNVTFNFHVNKSWFGEKDISKLVLERKSENSTVWETLNTTLISEDSNYYSFQSLSPGFSVFTIFFNESICTSGELVCSDSTLYLCNPDKSLSLIEYCEFGCSSGKCSEYWEPEENESIFERVKDLFFGTLVNFGNLVFIILVAIILTSMSLISYIIYRRIKRIR